MTITNEVVETKLEEEFYIGEEGVDDPLEEINGVALQDFQEGTEVANGSYVVPKEVAVEELKNYGGQKDLKDKCPDDVRKMLQEKSLFHVYDHFVQSIVDTKTTRGSLLGKWKDQQFISVLDQFRDDFTAKGVKVALCKRKSGKGTYRWLEFIDVEKLDGSYVPQYDVSNFSGQIIKTCHTKLEFPNGVAVEELKQWGGREKLKEKIPIHVEKMLQKYDLIIEYKQMVDHVVEAGVGCRSKMWKIDNLRELMEVYKPMFSAKGVDSFVCHKEEYISHGQYGGHTEYFRWIEFVDRAEQPSYQPQRDAETKKDDGCVVM
eukprot:CAMPEP_0201996062 /NCGR_PEP_ID=MMETSP0905-20130828/3309_1 /ASSEMBLY_ACC=CAM_ASM_000554 /TAXON_ID=420261 /ORGANISM="Thalassiosira antarctica, Strain CCMP982" /LENGTH=317 /DNA_ID=CAMNT_0048551299 /DNA_START=26 /DNA_END=979 /DNA_ORIENTATION=+